MSGTMLRNVVKFAHALARREDDTVRRLAYVAPRGVDVGEWFELPMNWRRALPIFGGLPELAERTARERIASVVAAGLLEVSGRLARLKPPGEAAVVEGAKRSRRAVSAVWSAAMASVASVADAALLRRSNGGGAAGGRRSSGGKQDVSCCFLIEPPTSSADGGGDALQGAFVASSSGTSFEAGSEATGRPVSRTEAQRRAERAEVSAEADAFVKKNAGLW